MINETENTITIPLDLYEELMDAFDWKCALEAGGVDNWDWYYESLQQAGYFDDE
jgi:hypothetical protein